MAEEPLPRNTSKDNQPRGNAPPQRRPPRRREVEPETTQPAEEWGERAATGEEIARGGHSSPPGPAESGREPS